MLFDIEFTISIPGIPTFAVVRSVEATNAREAIEKADTSFFQVQVMGVRINSMGVPVTPDPYTVVVKK